LLSDEDEALFLSIYCFPLNFGRGFYWRVFSKISLVTGKAVNDFDFENEYAGALDP